MSGILANLPRYWKGILAFIAPGAVVLGSAITAGSDGGTHVTEGEWVTALLACVVTGGAVTAKANARAVGRRGRTSTDAAEVVERVRQASAARRDAAKSQGQPCPYCKAQPGLPCRTSAGQSAKRPHRSRTPQSA